jgi:His/Glu/Gln/Arg/opine family amino acid ABC transporter permease subunit
VSQAVAPYWGVLVKGLMTTLWISWLALILGGLIGAIVGTARTSPWRVARLCALAYTEVFRSIPPLLLVFGVFFGLKYMTGLDLSPFTAATLALTVVASSFMSEVVRAGLMSVGRGQWDAAWSAGMRTRQVLRYIVWPQAIRVMLPPSVGVYIGTLKDSSLASVIGYVELTKAGLLIRETTGVSFEVFLIVAALYFTINYGISRGGASLERKFHFVH